MKPSPFIVGIPSNRPARLRTCLLNVLESLKTEGLKADVVVCDGSGNAEENQAFANDAAQPYGVRVTVQDEKKVQAAQPEPLRLMFAGPFGGPRNAILLKAVQRGANVVFIDDDVVPTESFFTRFQTHFEDGHKIVVGAYAGKRTGAVFLMDKVHRALTDFAEKRISRAEAAKRAKEAFCGMSDDWPPSEGYAGGCLGVSLEAASTYAFFPSAFRMEDSLYCLLSGHFLSQDAFMPFLPDAPVGMHKPPAGPVHTLIDHYLNALQGACVGKSIRYALEQYGKNPTPKQIQDACHKAPQDLLEQFNPENTRRRREKQKSLDEAVQALGEADLQREYDRFVHVGQNDAKPDGLENHVQRFFDVQNKWADAVGKTAKEK